MIERITTINHSDEWHALRKKGIGGSDASAVVGMNPFKSAFTLYCEKCGLVDEFKGNLSTEVGTYLEEFVAKKFEEMTGKRVRCAGNKALNTNVTFFNSDYPFAFANVDRLVVGENAGLEIKTTSELNTRKFKGQEFPEQYYCQCVHYLAVTGKDRWYLAVLIGNKEIKIYVLERDEEEIKALMDAEREFWENHVKAGIAPMIDGSKNTSETIKSMYSETDNTKAEIENLHFMLTRLDEYNVQASMIKECINAIQSEIQAKMGASELAECEGYKVTWKASQRTNFNLEKFSTEHPEIDLEPYKSVSRFRTFKIKNIKQ